MVKSSEESAQLFTAINVSHTKAYIMNVKSEECFWKYLSIHPQPETSIQSSQLRMQENFYVLQYGVSRWLTLSCYSIEVL